MFRVRIEAFENYRNVVRPLMMESVYAVEDIFNLNKKVLTFFNGEVGSNRLPGTSSDSNKRDDHFTDLGFDDRQFIEVEIEDSEGNADLDSCHRAIMNTPVWRDDDSNAFIVPNYVTKEATVTINRYCRDKVSAERLRDRINSALKEPRIDFFSCLVHYPIDNGILLWMEEFYNLLVKVGKVDSEKVNLLDWVKSNCKVPSDVIGNAIGNNSCFVFKRSLERLRLRYDGINIAKSIVKGKYYGQFLVSFQYKFNFAELKQWELHYPIMVKQNLIDKKWIPRLKQESLNAFPSQMFYEAMVGYKAGHLSEMQSIGMFYFPREDYGRLPELPFMDQKLQRLTILDDVENQVAINIFKFGGEDKFWNEKFKYFIQTHASRITTTHKTPFLISLWADEFKVLENQVELTTEGDLYLKRKPTMEAEYRMAFHFDYAVDLWDSEMVREILEDEDMGRWLLGVLFPYLPLPGDKNYFGPTKSGSYPWINWEIDVLNKVPTVGDSNSKDYNSNVGLPVYTADGYVIAKNENDLTIDITDTTILNYTATEYFGRK